MEALSDAAIRPSVCLSHLGQLGAQRLGQATRAVRTADPSAHGRRSAAIGGGHIVSSARLLVKLSFKVSGRPCLKCRLGLETELEAKQEYTARG